MQLKSHYDTLVLGAGLSGLSAGFELHKQGVEYAVLEKSARAGGVIQSKHVDGLTIEYGPNSLVATPAVNELLKELDLEKEIIHARQESNIRQILWDDQLHTLKASPLTLITTRLLSVSGKLRILKEPFIKSKSPAGESVYDFFERRFGTQVAQRMAGAIVSGIYAGDARELEMASVFPRLVELEREFGSVLKGLKNSPGASRKIITLKNGLESLVVTLSRKQNNHMHLDTEVVNVNKNDAHWKIKLSTGEEITASRVISTLPSYALLRIMPADFPKLIIDYNPMLTLQTRVDLAELERCCTGFGFLASGFERKDLIGVMYNALVFETARTETHGLINFFIKPDHTATNEPKKLLDTLCQPLFEKWTGYSAKLELLDHKNWPQAIPQKKVGHHQLLNDIAQWELQNTGFKVAGNFVSGVSLGDCIDEHCKMAASTVQ
ncbi:protoporphyrinogen oxidase [Nonlabens ponticola]|uniref:Coproporphyrinogen III oxidase n=1 Tax=Nonlabens ponticola TaxID=2496866 RepID=A0A3S9MXH7_9FLAO|nr:protoporphyrinogen oxidase [Nonlabens ponticola]AZQ43844.1 protoporphyrinogen oxidase [Nonlabens ponticola]